MSASLDARCDRAFASVVPTFEPLGRTVALGDDLLERLTVILRLRAAARRSTGYALVVLTAALEQEAAEFLAVSSTLNPSHFGTP